MSVYSPVRIITNGRFIQSRVNMGIEEQIDTPWHASKRPNSKRLCMHRWCVASIHTGGGDTSTTQFTSLGARVRRPKCILLVLAAHILYRTVQYAKETFSSSSCRLLSCICWIILRQESSLTVRLALGSSRDNVGNPRKRASADYGAVNYKMSVLSYAKLP